MTKISQNHRANFEKLATYLEKLPKDYEHFDMTVFFSESYPFRTTLRVLAPGCGAVACALGHGPAAGVEMGDEHMIPPQGPHDVGVSLNWSDYSDDNFTPLGTTLWSWVFNESWDRKQPTHRDAAARIRYFLDNDRPPTHWSFDDDRWTVY